MVKGGIPMCAVVNQSHFQTLHIPLRRYFLIRSSLFKKRSTLEIFNKKALYIYIREITGCDTPSITKVTKTLKKYYIKAYNQWETGQPIVL